MISICLYFDFNQPISSLTYLIDEPPERRIVLVDHIVVVLQIGVQRKLGQRLPRRLVRHHIDAVHVQRRVLAHRRVGDHRHALHVVVAQLQVTVLCD